MTMVEDEIPRIVLVAQFVRRREESKNCDGPMKIQTEVPGCLV